MTRHKILRYGLALLSGVLLLLAAWTYWAESQPEEERALRIRVKDQLEAMFPEAMTPPAGVFGWHAHQAPEGARSMVVLVHGLDEPGDIWQDVVETFRGQPVAVMEFRYPNDQAIDASADFLAEQWPELAGEAPVIFIAHSMGGLVVRDFVTRHYESGAAQSTRIGPPVQAAWLVATPNYGSNWARLRVWLELRDHFASPLQKEYALFSALRDGTGAAKIDLRPGSQFLEDLNAREWPRAIGLRLIAGVYLDEQTFVESLDDLVQRMPDEELAEAFLEWGSGIREATGDGVVTLESVALPDAPPPVVLQASHRGLIRSSLIDDGEPPALPILLEWLEAELGREKR